jgi:uncharacterized membrane protein
MIIKNITTGLNSIYKTCRFNRNFPSILCIVAFLAIGLMVFGLAAGLLQPVPYSFPGPSTLSISQIVRPVTSNVGLVMMSVGIILFALFPSLRVLSGINQFRHNHEIINLIIAVIVLIELTAGVLLIFVMKGVRT